MAEINDPREKMATDLVKRGHATMKELLTASFGEWPPRGLDINPAIKHDQEVAIVPTRDQDPKFLIKLLFTSPVGYMQMFWERLNGTVVLGEANMRGDRTIGINQIATRFLPFLERKKPQLNLTLGHEATHILQSDHGLRARKTFGDVMAEGILQGHNDEASNMIMKKLTCQESFNNAARKDQRLAYLMKGVEVQARLHEIMINGYPRWGKLPTNREELWASLSDGGMLLPPHIKQHLNALPLGSSANSFRTGKGEFNYTMQRVNNTLSKDGQEKLWHETLPALYADLIEMYGDKPGRERFGFGPNPKTAVLAGAAVTAISPPGHKP